MKILFTFVMCLCLSASGQFLTIVNVVTTLDTNCSDPVEISGAIVPNPPPPCDSVPFSVICYPDGIPQTNLIDLPGVYYYTAVNGQSIFTNPARVSAFCTNSSPLGTQPPDPQDNNNNNNNNDNNNGGPPSPCGCGMPVYNVSEPYLSLWLHDEPLGYQRGLGPRLALTLDYKQRETNSGYNPNWFSFGKKWNSGWLSYVSQIIDSASGNSSNVVYYADGGSEEYYLNNVDLLTRTILTGNTNSGFTLTKPDGSMDIYDFIVNNTNGAFEEAFLSQRVNSQGQSFTLQYANYTPGPKPVIRLLYLIDGDSKTNTLSYNSTNAYSSNVVTKVTDPFMRSAYMAYNSNGNLTNLIDVAANSTAINYDTNDWVASMVTPYGRTSFSIIDNGTNQTSISRAVLITRPDSSRELYLNEDMAPGVTNAYPANALPNTSPFSNTFDDYALNFHDTFYWGPLQYQNLSTTNIASFDANDFLLADMKHWLAQYGNFNPSSSISFERAPSPDAGGTIEGQKTWYDYTGKSYNQWQGSWYQPSIIARVLPDTSSAFNL